MKNIKLCDFKTWCITALLSIIIYLMQGLVFQSKENSVKLEENSIKLAIVETKVDMVIKSLENEYFVAKKQTTNTSESSLVFTEPFSFVHTEEKTIENLAQQDIIINY